MAHTWTEQEKEVIRCEYRGTRASLAQIAGKLNLSPMKAAWHNGRQPTGQGSAMWHIDQEDLKQFIRKYPQDLNGRNVDMIQIVEILAGIDYRS